uniref:Branched-chain amino acid ABC transporter permease n=1 Tax=Thermofilum pendens TaxID=2269 RepID=A0A7C4FE25_THEPE
MIPGYPYSIVNFLHYFFFYLLFSLPLTLSYRNTKVINFAHSNFITYGMYTAVFLHGLLGNTSLLLAALAAFLVGGSMALLNHIAVFRPLGRRGASPSFLMIASMGLWIMYNYLLYMLADVAHFLSRKNFISYSRIVYSDVPELSVAGYTLSQSFVASFLAALILVAALFLFLERTRLGRAMRAVSDNPVLAEVSGIPRDMIINLTWLIAGGVAAVGGAVWTCFSGTITPQSGDAMILQVFTVSFIGGLVSLLRTGLGALAISFIENIGIAALNTYFGIPTSFRPFLTFTTLLAILIASPPLGAAGGLPYRFRRRRWGL